MSELPLKCAAKSEGIVVSVGNATLTFAAENHPEFWNDDCDENEIKVVDPAVFAKEVERELNREEEDGSTLVSRMFDEAIKRAVENGCEGIYYED